MAFLLRSLACSRRPLRPRHLARTLRCQSTSSSQSSQPDLARLLATPTKELVDTLDRTRSGQLDILLNDLFPASLRRPYCLREGYHLIYFPLLTPPSKLAADGADKDHWPGEPYNHRVWASGSVSFQRRPFLNQPYRCNERIAGAEIVAPGTENEAVRVVIQRTYDTVRGPPLRLIDEERVLHFKKQELLSRPKAIAPRIARPYTKVPDGSYTLTPSPLHLFQFSALSYNAHYIHYDQTFAQQNDGHRERLVQAPLLLALLLRVATVTVPFSTRPQEINYRNLRPLVVNEPMTICWKARDELMWDFWILNADGELAVRSTVRTRMKSSHISNAEDPVGQEHDPKVLDGQSVEPETTATTGPQRMKVLNRVKGIMAHYTSAGTTEDQRPDLASGIEHSNELGGLSMTSTQDSAQAAGRHDYTAVSKAFPLTTCELQEYLRVVWSHGDALYIRMFASATGRAGNVTRYRQTGGYCVRTMERIVHAMDMEDHNLPDEQRIGEGQVTAQDFRDAISHMKGALGKCPEAAERFWAKAEHRQDKILFDLPRQN